VKSRGIVGRRIVEIVQSRVRTNAGAVMNLDAIVLDDGTRIHVRVCETPDLMYAVEATATRRQDR